MIGIATAALVAAIALILLTSALHRSTVNLTAGMERVRLLMELESYALEHVRQPAGVDTPRPTDVFERLRAGADPQFREEVERLDRMIESAAVAPMPADREAQLDGAVATLRQLVAREQERAQQAVGVSGSLDRIANTTGMIAVVLLVGGVAAGLAWLWRRAFEPLMSTIAAIERFAGGDHRARAGQHGPQEIQHLAVAFNSMADSLLRQREQQLAFIGGVAHDLRNPLAALHAAVGLLDAPQSDPVRVRERIRRQVDRLSQMAGDLLDRTRVEAGRLELHLEELDLRELVARVTDIHRESSPMRPFTVKMPSRPVPVRCDPLRIEQVLNNLLSNAAKYSPESSEVGVVLGYDDGFAMLSVADHGIGISAADRARVFEPFRRGTNVGEIGGAGLGLAVTKKLVEAHQGTIEVRSEPGKGSVFVVRLPLTAD
jgi:signal transduction histidine kinase